MKKTVYCYARVSSRGQAKDGYGMSRQQKMLNDYVSSYDDSKHHRGYELGSINWLFAEGISAYSGKNIEDGSVLKRFIDDVLNKKIINAVCVIENLDRFSRAEPVKAANLFLNLITAGCDIHEVETETVHHSSSDLSIITGGLQRAHNESKRKARLSIKNWDERIKNAISGEDILTHRVPSWLEVKNNRYAIKVGEKEKYNLIFTMYIEGFGPAAIRDELKKRKMLINDNEPTINHLNKIIKDQRLIGKFSSTGRKMLDGMVIYPVVVDLSLFHAVEQLRRQRNPVGKINLKANNLFAGLCVCAECGRYIQVNGVDRRGDTYFRCGGSLVKSDKCQEKGYKYKTIENVLLEHIRHFDAEALHSDDSGVQIKINNLTTELLSKMNYRDEVLFDLEKEDIPDPNDRRILKNLQKRIIEIESEISVLRQSNINSNALSELKSNFSESLRDTRNKKERLDFNIKIKRIIRKILIKRYYKTIIMVINYISVNEKQVFVIDNKTGEVLYMGVQNDDMKSVEHLIRKFE